MIDLIDPAYFVTVVLFIVALERMGRPNTAYSGIAWAGVAMAISVIVSFLLPGISNVGLILLGIVAGSSAGWYFSSRVAMTDMPQMVAIFNGMGAGAAASIATIELLKGSGLGVTTAFAMAGSVMGCISVTGSIVAYLKLQGLMGQKPLVFRGQHALNFLILSLALAFSASLFVFYQSSLVMVILLLLGAIFSLLYGFMMALPIGGADMPVIIALFNSLTGIAVALDGYSISNYAMIVAGILVGTSGIILTLAMAKAMNRNLANVLFGSFGKEQAGGEMASGTVKALGVEDAAIMLSYSDKVIVVPGFGMASAQAQFLVKDLMEELSGKGIKVYFAIHPVAGRMPGHMNVLLAEAGVPYELLMDLDASNRELENAGVALVIGANDVVNPAAEKPGNPLFGMPILQVYRAKNVIVMKRGQGKGFSGIENSLFSMENTRMLYGDARESVSLIIESLKKM